MKKIHFNLFLILLLLNFWGCQPDDVSPLVEGPQLSFQITRNNSDHDMVGFVEHATITQKKSGWIEVDGKVWLSREVYFDAELKTGEHIEIGFQFMKNEVPKSLLILEDEELNYWERNWDFKEFNSEALQFYRNFGEARVMVTPYTVFFKGEPESRIEITNVEQVLVNGKEKSQITLRFSGNAYGWYDPHGSITEWYTIHNGYFKGIIE